MKQGLADKPLAITIPSYTSIAAYQALLDSCTIAGFKAILVDESTAIVHQYAYQNMAALGSDKMVAFVDIGYSSTTVTIAKFGSNG